MRQAVVDRRSGLDRREIYDITYFERSGIERRSYAERRVTFERRKDWTRITAWSSVLDSKD